MRGHSSLFAAMDAVIEVVVSASGRAWNAAKAKDDEMGISHDFELVPYVVDIDQDELEITSCAVRRTLSAPVAKAKPLSGKHQVAAMAKLRQILSGHSNGVSPKVATQEVAAILDCPKGRAASVAKDTVDRLIVNRHLYLNEGVIKLQ
jgi:putative DNA primase/helicase